jgi:hypothetical protein
MICLAMAWPMAPAPMMPIRVRFAVVAGDGFDMMIPFIPV